MVNATFGRAARRYAPREGSEGRRRQAAVRHPSAGRNTWKSPTLGPKALRITPFCQRRETAYSGITLRRFGTRSKITYELLFFDVSYLGYLGQNSR